MILIRIIQFQNDPSLDKDELNSKYYMFSQKTVKMVISNPWTWPIKPSRSKVQSGRSEWVKVNGHGNCLELSSSFPLKALPFNFEDHPSCHKLPWTAQNGQEIAHAFLWPVFFDRKDVILDEA